MIDFIKNHNVFFVFLLCVTIIFSSILAYKIHTRSHATFQKADLTKDNFTDSASIKHLACLMDGNRRWARRRGMSPWLGHREGVKALERTIDFCLKRKIPYLSLYTFSIENFGRSEQEKSYLFEVLFAEVKERLLSQVLKKNVRVRFIGDRSLFPLSVVESCQEIERKTDNCTALTVNLLFCYGAQQELVAAVKDIVKDVQEGKITSSDIDKKFLYKKLWLGDVPAPELIIRAGGDQRLSNFLLYQAAYSDLYFLNCLWPDVDETHLGKALEYLKSCRTNVGK